MSLYMNSVNIIAKSMTRCQVDLDFLEFLSFLLYFRRRSSTDSRSTQPTKYHLSCSSTFVSGLSFLSSFN